MDLDDPISGSLVDHMSPTGDPLAAGLYSDLDLGSGSGSKSNIEAKPQNVFEQAAATFAELWQAKYHAKYFLTPGDKNQLGRMLQGIPRESLCELKPAFMAYLADTDHWVAHTRRHSLMEFCVQGLNKYRAGRPAVAAPVKPLAYDAPKTSQARGWQPNGERLAESKRGVRGEQQTLAELLEEKMVGK